VGGDRGGAAGGGGRRSRELNRMLIYVVLFTIVSSGCLGSKFILSSAECKSSDLRD